jgi:uncharacterized protein
MFWQGSWQLLYRPRVAITRTPDSASIAFDEIGFAATEAGIPQMHGWRIPADDGLFTVLYCHAADGNLSDAIPELIRLHAAHFNVFAFDYRGYGRSQFVRPSERSWKEDGESALAYLTATRHINPRSIIVAGSGLGANLALEIAASHPELAGVIVEDALSQPTAAIFQDPRAHMVPAHWLVADRWDLTAAASGLHIPSLWFCHASSCPVGGKADAPASYQAVPSRKMLVWLTVPEREAKDEADALARWAGSLDSGG